jgi:RNA polymerase sigma factor (TIGR02999 family)
MRKRSHKNVTAEWNISTAPGLDRQELDDLFSATYEELRRLASTVRSGEPGATLNPTALVHEAWLKLVDSPAFAATSRVHFKRIAARAMRQLLVDAARRRHSQKRGGQGRLVALELEFAERARCEEDVLRLDAALDTLSKLNPRQAEMVEGRFFGGLEVPEVAALLEVSEATVLRDWRAAKAWLANEIRR